MLLIIRDSVLGSKIVFCPIERKKDKENIEVPIKKCRKECPHFKGYKTVYKHKLLMCEYYYNQKYNNKEE